MWRNAACAMSGVLWVCGLLVLDAGEAAAAGIYRWVDAEGGVHFGDRPPAAQAASPVEVRVNTYPAPSIETLGGPPAAADRVVMYSASWCGVCRQAKEYFRRKGIHYAEYDIETSDRGRRDFARLGAKGVPVILVGNRRLNGFSEAAFSQIYPSP